MEATEHLKTHCKMSLDPIQRRSKPTAFQNKKPGSITRKLLKERRNETSWCCESGNTDLGEPRANSSSPLLKRNTTTTTKRTGGPERWQSWSSKSSCSTDNRPNSAHANSVCAKGVPWVPLFRQGRVTPQDDCWEDLCFSLCIQTLALRSMKSV